MGWPGFHNLELKLDVITANARNCPWAWIFRRCNFTDPSLRQWTHKLVEINCAIVKNCFYLLKSNVHWSKTSTATIIVCTLFCRYVYNKMIRCVAKLQTFIFLVQHNHFLAKNFWLWIQFLCTFMDVKVSQTAR